MQCPNCKTDLVNINGRFICSDCGKEVPEAEINVGDWGQGSFGGDKTVPEPVTLDSLSGGDDLIESEDYLVGESKIVAEDKPNQEIKVAQEAVGVDSDEGFYVPEKIIDFQPTSDVASSNNNELPIDSTDTETTPKEVTANVEVPQAAVMEEKEPSQDMQTPLPQLPEDPNIYRDPIAEDVSNEAPVSEKKVITTEQKRTPQSKKMAIMIVSIGIVFAILLLGFGLFAYFALTKESSQVNTEANTVLDTNNTTVQDAGTNENATNEVTNTEDTGNNTDSEE